MAMTDNFYAEDLLRSLRKETTMERYLPLEAHRDTILSLLREHGIVFRDEITDEVTAEIGAHCGADTARLFSRFLHLYDFNPKKLRELRAREGTEEYEPLADLLRLPGVRILRAELYLAAGVTLRVLAERPTEEIREMVRDYIARAHRTEIVPQPKEVNCHRAVAAMILHAEGKL